ncbi:hypothetical protein ACF0H5_012989 [Mactra antiquata]
MSTEVETIDCHSRSIHFLQASNPPYVALASFPGSGNTWTRLLLEELTGIYTGSIYTDGMSKMSGSRKCPLDGEVFIIKTHATRYRFTHPFCKSNHTSKGYFGKAIFILRDPYNALIADFNRHKAGKITTASQEVFKSTDWRVFVTKRIKRWRNFVLFWIKSFHNPRFILIYEQLVQNKCEELTNVAEFLSVSVSESTLACLLATDETQYKRTKPQWLFKSRLFDRYLRDIVNREINQVASKILRDSHLFQALKGYLL